MPTIISKKLIDAIIMIKMVFTTSLYMYDFVCMITLFKYLMSGIKLERYKQELQYFCTFRFSIENIKSQHGLSMAMVSILRCK